MARIYKLKNKDGSVLYPVTVGDAIAVDGSTLTGRLADIVTKIGGKADKSHTHAISNISGLQGALDGKAAVGHNHDSSYLGINATAAEAQKLTVDAGSLNVPVYFSNGVPVSTGRTLSDAASKGVVTVISDVASTDLPTAKAVVDYVSAQMTSVLSYKGTVSSTSSLPSEAKTGDVYVVGTNGSYNGVACEVGDYIICRVGGAAPQWDIVNGENQVSNSAATLAWDTEVKIATVDGTDITVKLPAKPADKILVDGILKGDGTGAVSAATAGVDFLAPVSAVNGTAPANQIIMNVTQSTNGQISVVKSGFTIATSVPAGAKFTDTTYGLATADASGLMDSSDKAWLDKTIVAEQVSATEYDDTAITNVITGS